MNDNQLNLVESIQSEFGHTELANLVNLLRGDNIPFIADGKAAFIISANGHPNQYVFTPNADGYQLSIKVSD